MAGKINVTIVGDSEVSQIFAYPVKETLKSDQSYLSLLHSAVRAAQKEVNEHLTECIKRNNQPVEEPLEDDDEEVEDEPICKKQCNSEKWQHVPHRRKTVAKGPLREGNFSRQLYTCGVLSCCHKKEQKPLRVHLSAVPPRSIPSNAVVLHFKLSFN